jgi:GNAT superfamily N-acetyltransferase
VSADPPGYVIDPDPARVDLTLVHGWLSEQAYWALGRSLQTQRQAHAGSRVYGVYRAADGAQVAIARAVTDGATFAWVCDVFVDSAVRGSGIGTWLVSEIVERLEAEGVLRVVLATRDAHEVYRRIGFESLANPSTWLERDRRPQRPMPGQFG